MPVTIIAEVGSVHDGSFGNALRLIDVAADCGADVVKFQTHISAAETLRDAPMPPYFKGEPRYEYFERTAFSREQWQAFNARCDERGVELLSSPFSIEAVAFLEEAVDLPSYKVASGEVTNLPLLAAIAQTGKCIYLSSGMSNWSELDAAVAAIQKYHDRLTILQCTSAYPCPYERVGLNIMQQIQDRYGLPAGLSDHTLTNYAAFAAVSLGASVIEKHLTFSRLMYGSDAKNALEPDDFRDLVEGVRAIETVLAAPVDKDNLSPYAEMKEIFEKSVVAAVNIPAGAEITRAMIGFKKPGTGIPAAQYQDVIGKRASRAIPRDILINPDDLEG